MRYETPVTQAVKRVNCLGPSSYHRPDFDEYRNRIIKRFEPEPWTSLIILLPCSAKKPYSESRSHKKYISILRKFHEFPYFQEIILTSPLGVVPRQLENVYPVNSYDISVTGDWDQEEKSITQKMLIDIIKKYDKSIPIIAHLDGEYIEVVKMVETEINRDITYSCLQKTTSIDSLQSLEAIIKENMGKYNSNIDKEDIVTDSWNRKIIKILDYQYGSGIGRGFLANGVKIRRDRTNQFVYLMDPKSKTNLGKFKHSSGQIALSLKGAQRLAPYTQIKNNFIVFDGESLSGSTLFRPGVSEFGASLMPDDHVLILNKDKTELLGLGQLYVGSNFIKKSSSGRIAKIYAK